MTADAMTLIHPILIVLIVAITASLGLGDVIVGDEIFATAEAAQAAQDARRCDPLCMTAETADRDKAVAGYTRAIELQPGARINAALAARVAELYAYGQEGPNAVRPAIAKAREWWQRTIQLSRPTQLLWTKAQMGLGSAALDVGDLPAAVEAFKRVLEIRTEKLELHDWQVRGESKDEIAHHAEGLRLLAAGEIGYAAARMPDKAAARKLLETLAGVYKGTAVGDCLKDQLARVPTTSRGGNA